MYRINFLIKVLTNILIIIAAIASVSCAKSGDLSPADAEQYERMTNLEERLNNLSEDFGRRIEDLEVSFREVQGRLVVTMQKMDTFAEEQEQLYEILERGENMNAVLNKLIKEQRAEQSKIIIEQRKNMDSIINAINDVEKLLKSPIADLPDVSPGDKSYKRALALMISGEFDLAAQALEVFVEDFSDHPQLVEALFLQGQLYFLIKKYENALIPFYSITKDYDDSDRYIDAKWMLARSLEESGDWQLASQLYTELTADDTRYKADAARRLKLVNFE